MKKWLNFYNLSECVFRSDFLCAALPESNFQRRVRSDMHGVT